MGREESNKQLRCCIYARVSSDEQADRNFSIPAQLEGCRYYAKGKGWVIVAEYHDGFESARPGKIRPTFEKMMESARRLEFDVILVHKIDRFARDDYEHVIYEREMEKLGIRLESVSEPLDPNSPAGYLSRRIMQTISSWYIKNLAAEAKKGMKQKVSQGGWPWLAPVGYVNRQEKNKAWVDVDPKLGTIITQGFKEMATGKYTLSEWTDRVFSLGYRNKAGGKISRSKWHDIFHNRFYMGKTGWGRKGEEYDGNHPALADPITFAQVQEVLSKHDHYKKRTQHHHYLLRGLLYSLDAKSPCLVSTHTKKGISYYRSKTKIEGSQVYYNCREVDKRVGELVKSMSTDKESRPRLETTLRQWLDGMGNGDKNSELNLARQRLEHLANKRKNISRLVAEELIRWDEFKELRDEVEREEADLKSRINFIVQHQTLFAADFDLALDIACNLAWLYEKGNKEERRLLVETLFKCIYVKLGKITDYELNPPFNIFSNTQNTMNPNGSASGPMVRCGSLVAGDSGLEPGLTDPESAVLPLDQSLKI